MGGALQAEGPDQLAVIGGTINFHTKRILDVVDTHDMPAAQKLVDATLIEGFGVVLEQDFPV